MTMHHIKYLPGDFIADVPAHTSASNPWCTLGVECFDFGHGVFRFPNYTQWLYLDPEEFLVGQATFLGRFQAGISQPAHFSTALAVSMCATHSSHSCQSV